MRKSTGRALIVILIAVTVILGSVLCWLIFRWDSATSGFATALTYLHDYVGLSEQLSIVLALVFGTLVLVATAFVFSKRWLLWAAIVIPAIGIPAALWTNTIASNNCENRKTGELLCNVWRAPDGGHRILRKDTSAPGTGWFLLGEASREDVRDYGNGTSEKGPTRIALESCDEPPRFFDANRPLMYWSADEGVITLWDRSGRHPTFGTRLEPITPKVAEYVCRQLAESKRKREEQTAREREREQQDQARLERERQQLVQQDATGLDTASPLATQNRPSALQPERPSANPYDGIRVR